MLDNFDVIFGLDFIKKDKITIIPYLDGILIVDKLYTPSYDFWDFQEKK